MSTPPRPYKRHIRNILIHRPLQREYTLIMIGMMMAVSLLCSFVIHSTMKSAFMGSPYHIGKVNPYEILSEVNNLLVIRVSITLFLSTMAATIVGIVFLHRVAGPVYRFRVILKRMAMGGDVPSDVRLREKDYFKEVAVEFNNVFKVLREKKKTALDVAASLEELSGAEAMSEKSRQALESAIQSLRRI